MSVPPRRRHRRHVHRRDADRRGDGRGLDREGADDAGRPVRGLHAGGRARARARRASTPGRSASSSTRRRSRRTRSSRARSPRSGFVTTEGFRDLLEIAAPGPPLALRPAVREAAAARPARPRASACASGSAPTRRGAAAARRRLACARRPRSCGARRSSRSPSACSTPTSTPSTSGGSARSCAEELPGVPRLALRRGRARVPRVPARLDDRDQRRHPPGRRALPASGSRAGSPTPGVEAKLLVMQSSGGVFSSRGGARAAGLHGRVGPGRRRDRLRLPRRDARPRATSSPSTWAARPPRSA